MKPVRVEGIVLTEADEESILYDAKEGKVHILNRVGAFIWDLCNGENTLEDISRAVAESFEVDEETAQKDIKEFIEELQGMDLLE